MNPAVGAGGVAGSHVRNGPALVVGRTLVKLQGSGVPRGHPWSTVKLIVPVAVATNDWTPNGPVTTYVAPGTRSEEHTSELQSRGHLVCRLLLEKKKNKKYLQYNKHVSSELDD